MVIYLLLLCSLLLIYGEFNIDENNKIIKNYHKSHHNRNLFQNNHNHNNNNNYLVSNNKHNQHHSASGIKKQLLTTNTAKTTATTSAFTTTHNTDVSTDCKVNFPPVSGALLSNSMKGSGYCSSIVSGYTVYNEITNAIQNKTPYLIGKLGQTELITMESWYKSKHNINLLNELFHTAGVFPLTQEEVALFSEIYYEATLNMNIVVKWGVALRSPSSFEQMLFNKLQTVDKINSLWPWWWKQPYSSSFINKSILIISPFAHYIEQQLKNNRTCIFPTQSNVLPLFQYYTLIPPLPPYVPIKEFKNKHAFNTTWTKELYAMTQQLDKLTYDIVIIGAGAYGVPLGAYVKSKGKIAIVLGGNLGPMFGLKGGRFDSRPEYSKHFYNDCWVKMKKPPGAERMENSAYW